MLQRRNRGKRELTTFVSAVLVASLGTSVCASVMQEVPMRNVRIAQSLAKPKAPVTVSGNITVDNPFSLTLLYNPELHNALARDITSLPQDTTVNLSVYSSDGNAFACSRYSFNGASSYKAKEKPFNHKELEAVIARVAKADKEARESAAVVRSAIKKTDSFAVMGVSSTLKVMSSAVESFYAAIPVINILTNGAATTYDVSSELSEKSGRVFTSITEANEAVMDLISGMSLAKSAQAACKIALIAKELAETARFIKDAMVNAAVVVRCGDVVDPVIAVVDEAVAAAQDVVRQAENLLVSPTVKEICMVAGSTASTFRKISNTALVITQAMKKVVDTKLRSLGDAAISFDHEEAAMTVNFEKLDPAFKGPLQVFYTVTGSGLL